MINNYIKLDYLTNFCKDFNGLNYNRQCEYIKNELLLLDLYDIQYIFIYIYIFKKLHALFDDLSGHIKKLVEMIGGIYTILVLN